MVRHYGFCTPAHYQLAIDKRIVTAQGGGVQHLLIVDNGSFTAHLLRRDHNSYGSIKYKFLTTWLDPDLPAPTVERIFFIHATPALKTRFEEMARCDGHHKHVEGHFHGTSQAAGCSFGKKVCSIV